MTEKLKQAWVWFTQNWWKIFVPLAVIGGVLIALVEKLRPAPVVIDPTAAADERAKIEEETRKKVLDDERARREREVAEVHANQTAERQAFEAEQAGEVEALRNDPDRLLDRMRNSGKRGGR